MKGIAIKRTISIIMCLLTVVSCVFSCPLSLGATAADASFEKEIASFPESYKPYLRELHEKYPKWEFRILDTGLEWAEVIAEESRLDRSLISGSASDLLKSKAPGDYNADTGKYIVKDAGGWVSANSIAVSYFMDPRNFLKETNIFQFELLSFSDAITVSTVEQVLDGTFMHDKKITYYDSKGNKKTIDKKYSKVIYDAGKKYNINPCYLAAKIRNEVGDGGSGSVSGKYSGYEGYYNFYNIYAYAGTNPIANGLKWAKSGTTYSRPWNNPEKSITGGAEWLAEKYIAIGQDTGYLQKFDVSPLSGDSYYTHQYMQNISAADSQGYSTYQSYRDMGLLSMKRVFSIPVFDNMPGLSQQTATFNLLDSKDLAATTTASSLNMRSTASTSGSIVAKILKGTSVEIIAKTKVDSNYYNTYLNNPFWYKIRVTLDKKTYTGYVSAEYIKINTVVNMPLGATVLLPNDIVTAEQPTYYSSNTAVARVNSDGTVTFLKKGSADLTAITSAGGYDAISIKVTSNSVSSLAVKDFTVSGVNGSAVFNWSSVNNASGYDIMVYQSGKLIAVKNAAASDVTATIDNLPVSEKLTSKIRAYTVNSSTRTNGDFNIVNDFTVNPEQVKNLRCMFVSKSGFTLDWNDVADVTGYEIYKYDDNLKDYKLIRTISDSEYTFKSVKSGFSSKYKVRAYKTVNGDNYYGLFSSVVTGYTYYKTSGIITQGDTDTDSIELSWKKYSNAVDYEVYKYEPDTEKLTKVITTKKTSYTAKKLEENTKYVFTVVARVRVNGEDVRYAGRDIQVSTAPTAPTGLKVKSETDNGYTVTWNKVENAVSYKVYKYDSAAGKYRLYDTVEKNSISITAEPLSSGTYKVRAGVSSGDGIVYSLRSDSVKATAAPPKVKGLGYTDVTTSSYKLTWDKVEGKISSYYIYRYDSETKKYKYIGSTKKTYYKIKDIKSGSTDFYIVKACLKSGSKKLKSAASVKLKVRTLPAKVKGVKISRQTETSYRLSWNTVRGAKGYEIYKYDESAKKYVRVAKTSKKYYDFKELQSTDITKYKVRAYLYNGSKKLTGKYSSVFTANTLPENTSKVTAKRLSSGNYRVTWEEVDGAGWYRIYVCNSASGKYKYTGKTEKCSYTLKGLAEGKAKVKIQSCMSVKSERYYSSGKIKSFTVKQVG